MDEYTGEKFIAEMMKRRFENMDKSTWGERGYGYRKCRNHFHIMSSGMDLIGGVCKTETEAKRKCDRLNDGEELDDVLDSWLDSI